MWISLKDTKLTKMRHLLAEESATANDAQCDIASTFPQTHNKPDGAACNRIDSRYARYLQISCAFSQLQTYFLL